MLLIHILVKNQHKDSAVNCSPLLNYRQYQHTMQVMRLPIINVQTTARVQFFQTLRMNSDHTNDAAEVPISCQTASFYS